MRKREDRNKNKHEAQAVSVPGNPVQLVSELKQPERREPAGPAREGRSRPPPEADAAARRRRVGRRGRGRRARAAVGALRAE